MRRQEIYEARTATTKLFENEDHSFTREIYLEDIHYQDDNGEWKDMNDKLMEEDELPSDFDDEIVESEVNNKDLVAFHNGKTEKDYVNKKGKWKVRFRKHARKQGTVSVTRDQYQMTWALENAEKVKGVETDNTVVYSEVLPGMDENIYIKGMTVKENLILKSPEVSSKITFLYHTKKLHPVYEENSINLLNDQNEEIFTITAPYMKDVSGEKSEMITVDLEEIGKDRFKVIFSVDETWLKSEARVYPVIVDPVTTTSKKRSDIYDAHVDSHYAIDNFQNSIILKTRGGDTVQRSYMKFTLPEIKTGDMVVESKLVMVSLAEDNKNRIIEAHRVIQSWDSSTINWFNKPSYDEIIEDVCEFTGDKQKYITMDITRLVKDWYQNGKNYGLVLRTKDELSGYTEFLSSDCDKDYENMRPRIDISYVNYSGLEDYWSYHRQEAGRAGTVYVNDYNGNVIMIHNTISTGGSRMPMVLNHVYNSNDKDQDIGYGNGMRLSYHQTIKKVLIAGNEYYKHIDGDGTAHYYVKDKDKNEWKDENGQDLVLTIHTSPEDAIYIITDKDKNKMMFSKNGYLRSICDKNGNTLKISYDNFRIAYVRDGAGRLTTLTYSKDSEGKAKTLLKVTGPDGKVKSFGYKNGCLTSVTDIDNAKMLYVYSEKNLLHQICNVDGYEVHYAYYNINPYRIKRIAEYGNGTKLGESLDISYGYNSTKFTDNKGRSEIYRFDNSGNLLHINDGFGHAASAKYSKEKNYTNRLKNETKLQTNVVQLLKDPIIQAKESNWHPWGAEQNIVETKINTDVTKTKIGTRSLQLTSKSKEKHCCWYQDIVLKKGKTYTFSMYVKTYIEDTGDNGRCYIRVRYYDKAKEEQFIASESVQYSTPEFIRLKVSFTVPEDAANSNVRVYMYMFNVKGSMYGDMAQLEPGVTANRCNLVDNGDFYFGNTSGFKGIGTTLSDRLTTVGKEEVIPVGYAMMVTKASDYIYSAPQTTDTTVVATVVKNQRLFASGFVTDKNGTVWYRVKTTDGKSGYIKTEGVCVYLPGGNAMNVACAAVKSAILRSTPSAVSVPIQEGIVKGTCMGIRTSVKDADGNKWYEVGMDIDMIRYHGYISTDSVVRLVVNTPAGHIAASCNCYETPSTAYNVCTLSSGTVLNIRGVVSKNNGEIWYGVLLPGRKEFAYVRKESVVLSVNPEITKMTTTKVNKKIAWLDSEGHIFKFSGDTEKAKRLAKTLDITGKTGDTYMVNAWGYGTSLPESSNDKRRRFGVEVVFIASDGKEDIHYTNFSPDIQDWQFLSDYYVAKQDYTSIRISYTYCYNANVAFFDGLSLYREEFGQSFTYDDKNNLISVINAQKKNHKFEYNENDDLTGITDPKGSKYTYTYDKNGNVKSGKSSQGLVYRMGYDAYGNIIKSGCSSTETDANGTWVTREFTEEYNHVTGVRDAEGNKIVYDWDAKTDLLKSVTDGCGNKLTYTYDSAGHLKSVSQKVTQNNTLKTVTNTYTYENDKLKLIGHNGFSYGFEYDAFGNTYRASIRKKEGDTEHFLGLVRYVYEEKNGNLERTVYGNKDYIRYTYDDMGRLILSYYYNAEADKEQKMNQYVYDRSGNLYKVVCYMAGKTYRMEYDLLDRLMRVTDEDGNGYHYTYDANNNMTSLRSYTSGIGTMVSYKYDKDDRETTTCIPGGKERTVTYDKYGRVLKKSWNTTKPLNVTYGYGTSNTRVGILPRTMKTGTLTIEYTYDANGNITVVTEKNGTKTVKNTYYYDELNQLIRENNQVQNKTFVYDYDLGGNMTKMREYAYTTGTVPKNAIRTETGTFNSVWKDKLMKWNDISMSYDAIGNMLKKGTVSFTWNQDRKLSTVNNGKKIRYYYDHTGNRVKKNVDGTITEYRMAGNLLISENNGDRTIWYRYDSGANLISMKVYGKEYFYVRNLQNDIIAMIDEAGETVVEYKYDSWGKTLNITGSKGNTLGHINPFRYRGYYYDTETGMYYLKNRYYDPEIRRFISPDKYVEGNNSVAYNIYVYCGNNPVSRYDPDGTFWKKFVKYLKKKVIKPIVEKVSATIKYIGNRAGHIFGHNTTASNTVEYKTPKPISVGYSHTNGTTPSNSYVIGTYVNVDTSFSNGVVERYGIQTKGPYTQGEVSIEPKTFTAAVVQSKTIGRYTLSGGVQTDVTSVGATVGITVNTGDIETSNKIFINVSTPLFLAVLAMLSGIGSVAIPELGVVMFAE